jgi:hypothetical protein
MQSSQPSTLEVDSALAFYWAAPELAPLRATIGELLPCLYPKETPIDATDPNSFWEIWNCVRGMLTDSKFSTHDYWDFGGSIAWRDEGWVQPHSGDQP